LFLIFDAIAGMSAACLIAQLPIPRCFGGGQCDNKVKVCP
jgi:hypothetical protein